MDELEHIRRKLAELPDPQGVLEGVFAFSPTALQLYAVDGTSLLTNEAFRTLFGSEPPPTYNVFRDEVARARGVDVLIQRAFAGEVVRVPPFWYDPREIQHVHVSEGRRVAVSAVMFPIRDPAGAVSHVVLAFRDETSQVSAREEAIVRERKATLFAEISASLGESLEAAQTLRQVTAQVVGEFADWATATLLGPAGEQERVAVVHRDPARAEDCERYLHAFAPPQHRPSEGLRLLESGRALFLPEVSPEHLGGFAHDQEHREVLHRLGMQSVVVAPLTARGRTVGLLSFVRGPASAPYDPADVRFAEELAARVGLAVDNARLYQAERALRDALEGAVRMRDDFLSIAAHELRTPLTALKLQLAAVRRRLTPDQPLTARVDLLDRQANRLAGLIDALLDLTRIASGRLQIETVTVDLLPLVREAVSRVQDAQDPRSGVPVSLTGPESLIGRWDPLRLDQVITNLLTNAVKYGAGAPVEVSVAAVGDQVQLQVRDHGMGIAPEDQARIFERFERTSSSRHYSGLGLGLWITRQTVVAMGGTITVQSAVGEGSTFTVTLPREPRT